ncbi:Dymeclin [Sporodiniella umbellata]|nr:Dymeclin [Sporodiniella umbellata]
MKHFTDNLTHKEIMEHIEDEPEQSKAKRLLTWMLSLLLNLDPTQNKECYEFYLEILTSFLALFSTQLRHPLSFDEPNYFLDLFLSLFVSRADAVVARLLENVMAQLPPPSAASASVVYTAYTYLFSSAHTLPTDSLPLADLSLLLLTLLGVQADPDWTLAFQQAMAGLSDHQVMSATELEACHRKMHLISFKGLLDMFSQSLEVEEKALLFYKMLSENESFRVYVLSRTDQETIYLPILKLIYESMEAKTNYPQLYLLMTVLLILSQDEVNNDAIQKIVSFNCFEDALKPLSLSFIDNRQYRISLGLQNVHCSNRFL